MRSNGNRWHLQHGPFDSRVFSELPSRNWTLLVQGVDLLVREVDALKSAFEFIPSWRIDDVMVSFASEGGGVGPHFDHYDVFLVQGMGSRRWQTGARCDVSSPLAENSDLRILKRFIPEKEYLLESGDILYIPPGFSHYGISSSNSLCYSIGFRAPSHVEALYGFTDALADKMNPDLHFENSLNSRVENPGQIEREDVESFYRSIHAYFDDPRAFLGHFGETVTQPKYLERLPDPMPDSAVDILIADLNKASQDIVFYKNPNTRMAYILDQDAILFFVNGRSNSQPMDVLPALRTLCAGSWGEPIPGALFCAVESRIELLRFLLREGCLAIEK